MDRKINPPTSGNLAIKELKISIVTLEFNIENETQLDIIREYENRLKMLARKAIAKRESIQEQETIAKNP